jgi:hypothetical protein
MNRSTFVQSGRDTALPDLARPAAGLKRPNILLILHGSL